MIGQIFLNSNKPYIITKLTPKTIFYKLLTKKIDVSYNNDVLLYSSAKYEIYTSYLAEPIDTDRTEKKLKIKFYDKIINYNIVNRVFQNGILLPENINIQNCDAIINPNKTKEKFSFKNKLMFLVFDMCKNDTRISKIKLDTIRELKAIFEAEPEQTTIMLNKITDELNREFQNLPHVQFNFLEKYNNLCSDEQINFYIQNTLIN